MASFTIKITGNPGASIQAALEKKKQQIDAVIQKTGADCEALAKQAAPVDTSFLKNSIHYEPKGPSSCEVRVGAYYGWYVEMGHHVRKAKGAGTESGEEDKKSEDIGFVPARPFLFPAFVSTKTQCLAVLKKIAGS